MVALNDFLLENVVRVLSQWMSLYLCPSLHYTTVNNCSRLTSDIIPPPPLCLKVLCSHQHGKRRQGQARWITSTARRYFQGLVIETNGLDTLVGILSPVPHRSKGDRAETRGTQPFQGSAVSWSLRKRAFSNTGTSHCLTTFSRGSFVFHRASPIQITWLGSLLQVQRVKWKVCESERHYCSVQETLRF